MPHERCMGPAFFGSLFEEGRHQGREILLFQRSGLMNRAGHAPSARNGKAADNPELRELLHFVCSNFTRVLTHLLHPSLAASLSGCLQALCTHYPRELRRCDPAAGAELDSTRAEQGLCCKRPRALLGAQPDWGSSARLWDLGWAPTSGVPGVKNHRAEMCAWSCCSAQPRRGAAPLLGWREPCVSRSLAPPRGSPGTGCARLEQLWARRDRDVLGVTGVCPQGQGCARLERLWALVRW